jgi:hypothetical protein
MATATARPHAGEIKFEYGVPQTFALKFLEPKVFENSFGPRGMFTTTDDGFGERKIWMDYEPASNMAIELRRLGVRVGEPLRVTKVKHQRGGGHGYLVERATPAAAPVAPTLMSAPPEWVTREEAGTEALLERSVELARAHGPQVFQRDAITQLTQTAPPAPLPALSSPLAEALCKAIDAALEGMAYAAQKGLDLTFSEESIRALAATQFIQTAKGGR